MRFVLWVVNVLGSLARGADAASGAGPGASYDETGRRVDAEAAHQRRREYRP